MTRPVGVGQRPSLDGKSPEGPLSVAKGGLMSASDRSLRRWVWKELNWDTRIDNRRITVDVTDGQVTLTGVVEHPGDMIHATDDVWMVPGVDSVLNELLVLTSGVEDIKRTSRRVGLLHRKARVGCHVEPIDEGTGRPIGRRAVRFHQTAEGAACRR